MRIWILTSEPYHDNSSLSGVYLTEEAGVAAWRATPNPEDINCDDYTLIEWDTESNTEVRRWEACGKQVYGMQTVPWSKKPEHVPIRKEFTFREPKGTS